MQQHLENATDGGLFASILTLPWWLPGLEGWIQAALLLGGLFLLILRILVAWREWRQKPSRALKRSLGEVAHNDED